MTARSSGFSVQRFDRPAFHDVIYQERSMEGFTTSCYRPLARIVLENTMPTTFWGHDPDLTRRPLSKSGATFSISVLPRNDAETDAWHGDAGGGRWRGSIQCSGDVDVTRLGPRPSRASRNCRMRAPQVKCQPGNPCRSIVTYLLGVDREQSELTQKNPLSDAAARARIFWCRSTASICGRAISGTPRHSS